MCKFYSALVKKNGDLLHDPHLISHEDLIDLFGLNDSSKQVFCRVEYSPKNDEWGNIDSYQLEIDERVPDWFTKSMQEKITGKLHRIVKNRIIKNEKRRILTGGYYILVDSEIYALKNVIIYHMINSIVESMSGSSIVKSMYDSSIVKSMSDSSIVESMSDSSIVESMSDSSIVESMSDSSIVESMYGSSIVKSMYDSSIVESMSDSSIVKSMYDSSIVESMYGSSIVKSMYDSSIVESMYGNAKKP